MKKFWAEFKEFAMKGNVMDMAVGVIIGGAFSKIITSLVGDVLMPLISLLTGRISFTDWAIKIPSASAEGGVIAVNFGLFLQNIFDFLITALCIFFIIKAVNLLHRGTSGSKPEEPAAPAAPAAPTQEELLGEIRDLLKAQAEKGDRS